ncbi:scavenger receptor class F member 2-like [Haliotis rubra]|uniref:scavenger receptor class F member 2-like n=1 Tax=Haliotis rubra TaxID=36100 RepID=UPI001EE5611A|nr:scavenger receptor class F member 2-like [Haliotis rubra]
MLCQQPCPDGSYGINCTYDCGNCLGADICDKTNGARHLGCAAGWRSNTTCLQACPNGSYGINCASQCGKCLDGVSCDKRNGACPGGCAAGWINDGTCLQRE